MQRWIFTKKEWVLNGETVLYGSASELRDTLEYNFSEERKFSYQNLSMNGIIHHLAIFVSRLWQIHIFGEGNTRTTAVFFIKYLRSLGFDATNDIFAENAWYFRNSLVRANYNDFKNDIHETTEYLELFLRNLLLDEKNELHNRSMHISGLLKSDIEKKKSDIEELFAKISNSISDKSISYIVTLYKECGKNIIFGRSVIEQITGLKPSRASDIIHIMLQNDLIQPVKGYGKGKYRFK